MSKQFNWKFDEDYNESYPRVGDGRHASPFLFWLLAALILGSILAAWAIYRRQTGKATTDLINSTQALLDLEKQALETGDGELFFALQAEDSNWFAAQLLPENQAIIRSGLRVTNAEQHGEYIWANATWQETGGERQRVLFFEIRGDRLRQVPTDSNYWGSRLQSEHEWGTLSYHQVDDIWESSIANYVHNAVEIVCAENCLADRLPLTLEVRDDFQETAAPGQITMPSPHLLGLDADGRPAPAFWQALNLRIENALTPATIRFAIPPPRFQNVQKFISYEQAAVQFMAAHPEISIELVEVENLPEDLTSLVLEFDGVAIPPTERMLTAGLVHDLTNYINSDPDFDQADFYEQIWRGSQWRDRAWFMPLAAEMRIIYYDKDAYQYAGRPEPSARWTWEEMASDVEALVPSQPAGSELSWGFLDVGLDALFSYAYNWNNACTETATVYCQTPLDVENIAAAFDWYAQMAGRPGYMPDLANQLPDLFSPSQMSALESAFAVDRQSLLLNFQGSRRKAAIWVDLPVYYEFNLLLSPVGVVPFPGSDRFDGITPLWLYGGFISQASERPLAVWQWLKFLSYQTPIPRLVPARPSVAAQAGYWTTLPRPLGEVMRAAFPFARAVTVEEQGRLTWEQVTAVVNKELTSYEAARQQPVHPWFSIDQ